MPWPQIRAHRRRSFLLRCVLQPRARVRAADSTQGGAYPLSTVDILAFAALVYLVTTAVRAARNQLDRPPAPRAKAQ